LLLRFSSVRKVGKMAVQLIAIIDLAVSFMRHMQFGGISLFFVIQVSFWITAVWYVVNFFISRLGEGSGG
jgi:hypothetical protein